MRGAAHPHCTPSARARALCCSMVTETVGRTPSVALLDAQLAWRLHRDRPAQLAFLGEAARLHLAATGLDAPVLTAAAAVGGGGQAPVSRVGSMNELFSGVSAGSPVPPLASVPSSAATTVALLRNDGQAPPASHSTLTQRLPPPSAWEAAEWYATAAPLLLLDMGREYLQQVESDPAAASGVRRRDGDGAAREASSALTAGAFGGPLGLPPHADALDESSSPFLRGVALVELALSLAPSCVPGWLLLAQANAAARRTDAAAAAVESALAADPSCPDALLLMAHVSLLRGDAG